MNIAGRHQAAGLEDDSPWRRSPSADLLGQFEPFGLAENRIGGGPGVGSSVVVAMITTDWDGTRRCNFLLRSRLSLAWCGPKTPAQAACLRFGFYVRREWLGELNNTFPLG